MNKQTPGVIPETVPGTVLETDAFLVINKPPGIPVHREGDIPGILEYLPVGQQYNLCHRLDRETSGLLLLGKTKAATAELSQLFEQREIQKYYLAISDRKPKKTQGALIGDMSKARRGNWKLERTRTHPAITRFFSRSHSPGLRSFIIKPETGRTHQIRVALASIASPILGDNRYKGSEASRLHLHAYQLNFCFQKKPYSVCVKPLNGSLFDSYFLTDDDAWLQPHSLNWPR